MVLVLADQVRRAIAWVCDSTGHLGSDPNQLYVGVANPRAGTSPLSR